MDLYTQALKVVCVKPPFGADECIRDGAGAVAAAGGMASPSSRGPPGVLKLSNSSSLDSSSNKRKHRARKTQPSGKKKSPDDDDEEEYAGEINPKHFWLQMEDYFREVTAEDMEVLQPLTNLTDTLQDSCLWLPPVPHILVEDAHPIQDDADKNIDDSMRGVKRKIMIAKDEDKKRRKGSIPTEPELITTIISPPDQDDEELCHVCNFGDSDESNQILFCDSCSVAVHQECYGINRVPAGQWLCSWCSYNTRRGHPSVKTRTLAATEGGEGSHSTQEFRCVLCTVNSGALKPIASTDSVDSARKSGSKKFAHLFCCQWVPETYIHDVRAMEPIKNIQGIREERWRLLCMICKEKHGVCIQCSHGLCAASFHPLCARGAGFLMEVSSKEESEEVDLRAYCPKHSSVRMSKPMEESDMIFAGDIKENLSTPETSGQKIEEAKSREADVPSKPIEFPVVPSLDNVIEQNSSREIQIIEDNHNGKEKYWDADVISQLENKCKLLRPITEEVSVRVLTNDADCTGSKGIDVRSDLIKLFKKVIQQTHESPAAVALQAGVPLSTLSMWLEGKLQSGSDNVDGSIKAWLSSQGLLTDSFRREVTSMEPDGDADCQDTVCSESGQKMNTSPKEDSLANGSSKCAGKNSFRKFSVSGVRTRAQHSCNSLENQQHFGDSNVSNVTEGVAHMQTVSQSQPNAEEVSEVCLDSSSPACDVTLSDVLPRFSERKAEDCERELEAVKTCTSISGLGEDDTTEGFKGILQSDSSIPCNSNRGNVANMPQNSPITTEEVVNEEKLLRGMQHMSSLLDPDYGSALKEKSRTPGSVFSGLETKQMLDQSKLSIKTYADEANDPNKKAKQVDGLTLKDDAACYVRQETAGAIDSSGNMLSHGGKVGFPQINAARAHPFSEEANCHKEPLWPFIHPSVVKKISELHQSTQAFLSFLEEQGVQRLMMHGDDKSQGNILLPASNWHSFERGSSRSPSVASDAMTDVFPVSVNIAEPPSNENLPSRSNNAFSDQSACLSSESNRQSPMYPESIDFQMEQFQKARDMHLIEYAPEDELEGELLFLQNELIFYAQANRFFSEQVIAKMIIQLPEERQTSQHRQEDLALVNQYLAEVKEAKKQGRKKRKEKEAQAVLAAATAAAAASSRLGYVRRDGLGTGTQGDSHQVDDHGNLVHIDGLRPSALVSSIGNHLSADLSRIHLGRPPLPKPQRFTVSTGQHSQRLAHNEKGSAVKLSSLSQSGGPYQVSIGGSVDDVKCDVCSGADSVSLNKIVTCDLCKVSVHQDCYGIGENSVRAWRCQPCSRINMQQQSFSSAEMKFQGSPGLGVQCALCPQTSGAFKQSTDGKWVHVFCAQWMPDTIVGKDQAALIEGLDRIPSERYSMACGICQQQLGACLKCNFGHCHGAFHVSCARDAGLFLSVRSNVGGRLQYRAYCERHSPQQRAKAEIKHESSLDDLNSIKQIRVELERVRLICERISRREKLKRDLLHCTKDLCIAEVNAIAASGSANIPENAGGGLPYKLSSQSSTYAHLEVGHRHPRNMVNSVARGAKISRVDDKRMMEAHNLLWNKDNVPSNMPQSATTINQLENSGSFLLKSHMSASFGNLRTVTSGDSGSAKDAGKLGSPLHGVTIAKREVDSKSHKKKRCSETLDREKVMTPIEASMHNRRLPKGYAYVPVDLLEKGTLSSEIPNQDATDLQHLSDGKLPMS